MTTVPTKRSRLHEIEPDLAPDQANNNMLVNSPSVSLPHPQQQSNSVAKQPQPQQQQPGIPTPHESQLESTLPLAPLYSMSYPHADKITRTAVSHLGIFITATENGSINLWHLGQHDKMGGVEEAQSPTTVITSQAKFRISFPLFTPSAPLLSLMVSSCGVYCVCVGTDGVVYVINLVSFVIENRFTLTVLPSTCLLLQQYTDPSVIKSLQQPSHAQHHYSPEKVDRSAHNQHQDGVSGPLLSAEAGTKMLTNNSRDLVLCVGTFTGHIFLYPLDQQISTVFVSFISQHPILSLSAVPLGLVKPLLHEPTLSFQQQKELLAYPFLAQARGYLLLTSDTQGNLETLYLPAQFTTTLPNLDLTQIGSGLTKSDITAEIDRTYNETNPHKHKVLGTGANVPQVVAIVKPQSTSMFNNSTSDDNNNNNNNLTMATITTAPSTTLFWGSLGHNLLPTIFTTSLYPSLRLKSQTDLFTLKKRKKIAISTQISPNGLYISLTCIPQPDTAPKLPPFVSTPLYFTHYILSTKTLKIVHTFDENYLTQYPSAAQTTLSLSAQFLFKGAGGSGGAKLEQTLAAAPYTNSIWDSVQLGSDLAPAVSNNNPNSSNGTMVPNPFYLPPATFSHRLATQAQFITAIFTNHINPLTTVVSAFVPFSTTVLQELTAARPDTTPVNPQQLPQTVCNTAQYDREPFFTTLLSTYKPIVSMASHSTGMIQSDLCIFDRTSEYLFYPTIFGVKCVRLRDGFTIVNPTSSKPSLSFSGLGQSGSSSSSSSSDGDGDDEMEYNLIGGKDHTLEPNLFHTNCLLIDQTYYSEKNDANLATISLLLSHNDKVAKNTSSNANNIVRATLNTGLLTPGILPSTSTSRQPLLTLHHPAHTPPSTSLITTGWNGSKVMQYTNRGGLPFLAVNTFPHATTHINLTTLQNQLTPTTTTTTTPITVTHSTHHFVGLRAAELTPPEITRLNKSREVLTQISSLSSSSSSSSSLTTNNNSLTDQQPQITLHTTYGDMVFKLYPQHAPKACENFITHARNGYYNNHLFHRVIKTFMVQTGDPTGTGTGGESIWGQPFEDEFSPLMKHDAIGTLALANSGPHSNQSQFYITTTSTGSEHLNNKHTVFGKIVTGEGVLLAIAGVKTNTNNRPLDPVKISSVTVSFDDSGEQ